MIIISIKNPNPEVNIYALKKIVQIEGIGRSVKNHKAHESKATKKRRKAKEAMLRRMRARIKPAS